MDGYHSSMTFILAIWAAAAIIVNVVAPIASWLLTWIEDAAEEDDRRMRARIRSEMEAARAAWRS